MTWPPPTGRKVGRLHLPDGIQLFGGPLDCQIVPWQMGTEIHVWHDGRIHKYEFRYTKREYIAIYKEDQS